MTAASSTLARAVAVALFAVPLTFALGLAAMNFADALSVRVKIKEGEDRLVALSGRLEVLDPRGSLDTSRIYLAGGTQSLAAASLRTHLVEALGRSGGQLVETRGVAGDPADGEIDAVLVGATFDIDNAGLARLLYALESGIPVIEVAELSLRRTESDRESANPLLRADLTIRAFRKGGGQ